MHTFSLFGQPLVIVNCPSRWSLYLSLALCLCTSQPHYEKHNDISQFMLLGHNLLHPCWLSTLVFHALKYKQIHYSWQGKKLLTEFEMIARAFLQRKKSFSTSVSHTWAGLHPPRHRRASLESGVAICSEGPPSHQDHLLARPLFTKSDLFRTISIFVFVQTGHFELIFSDRVSPSGRDFLRKRYLEGELHDGEDLPNCYDQVRQKKHKPTKTSDQGIPLPPCT